VGALALADSPHLANLAELKPLDNHISAIGVKALRERGVRVVDLSADFRLRDVGVYEQWYREHHDVRLVGPYLLAQRHQLLRRAVAVDAEVERLDAPSLEQGTLRELARRGTPFVGALYAGLMLTPRGLRVLEFNCRLGDPEAQAILIKLRSDPLPLFLAAAKGRLAAEKAEWDPRTAVAVVLAAHGYPGAPRTGDVILGADREFGPDVAVFHAGVARRADGALVTAGEGIALESVRTYPPTVGFAGSSDVYYIVSFRYTNGGTPLVPRIDHFVLEDDQKRRFLGADSGNANLVGIANYGGVLQTGDAHEYTVGFRVPQSTHAKLFYDATF